MGNASIPNPLFFKGNMSSGDFGSIFSDVFSKLQPKRKSKNEAKPIDEEIPISSKTSERSREQTRSGKKKHVFIRKQIPADVLEGDDKLVIRADIPGVVKDNIKVECMSNVLSVSVTRRTAAQPPEGIKRTAHHNEIPQGAYARSFKIPDSVDTSSIKASYDDGVLTLTMRKKPKPKLVKIPVA
eukprot:CAMPEP_0170198414 /NCGR_PEP_ID=MMETSP0040_2-20121228/68741_1 /TAXON_ID=641309 /ORGANISM="Lotharella oceanica, Strain CCMP622" /LENGTH=183 /DNA_ID=CAMNT_0010448367 /DNA_START=296 /DNA_END=847 /DNA_ORIENTATION=+